MQETWAQSLGQEDTLGEEMAALFSILAGIIPKTEQLGGDWAYTLYIYPVIYTCVCVYI